MTSRESPGLLDGPVAVVTGDASGIGRSICERFASAGARAVVVADLRSDPRKGGPPTVDLVRATGAEAVFVETDVTDPAQADAAVAAADAWGASTSWSRPPASSGVGSSSTSPRPTTTP